MSFQENQGKSFHDNGTSEFTEDIARVGSHGTSQAEEKALVRKIDLFLLPTIWLMYLLSYVDRTKSVQIMQHRMTSIIDW